MTNKKHANCVTEEVRPTLSVGGEAASNSSETEKMNDATIRGKECPEMLKLIHKPFVVMTGQIFGSDDRRNTKAGNWNRVELPLSKWLYGWKKGTELLNGTIAGQDFGLTRWKYTKRKGGDMVVLADAIKGAKTEGAIKTLYAIGLDVDNQTELPFAVEAMETHNLFGLVYPTFRHMTTELELDHDAIVVKLSLDASPSLDDVKQYLREHHKDRYADSFIDAVEIFETSRQTDRKQITALKTPPQHKFRIFLFLSEPVELASLGTTLRERKAAWADAVQGVADMLGVEIDPSTKDINRGFFVPQLPHGSDHQMYIVQGRPLHFDEIPQPSKNSSKGKRGFKSKRRPDIVTEDGTNISALYDEYGKRWLLAEIAEHSGLETTASASNGSGKFHVRCPFADGHTDSADDGATFAMNAEDSHTEFAVVDCQHGSCKSANQGGKRHLVDYLGAWIDEGVLDPAILEDPEFMVPMPDEGQEEKFFRLTSDETKGQAEDHEWIEPPFILKNCMIYKIGMDDNPDRPLCQAFYVLGRSSNLSGEAGAGRIIRFENENGVDVEVTLDRSALFRADGGGALDTLADAGMDLRYSGRNGRGDMLDLLRTIKSDRQIPIAPHGGWTRDRAGRVTGFLCPTGEFIPAGADAPDMRLHSSGMVRDRQPSGMLDGWKDAASAAKHNFYWSFGLYAGFSGALLDLVQGQTCGVHLSGESTLGKTYALLLSTTVWGSSLSTKGLFWVMNNTPNALEDIATIGSGTIAALDEVGAMQNPASLGGVLFGLSSNSGKNRKEGRGAGLAGTAEFCTFVLMSHERSLKTTIEDAGGDYKTGLSVRFPDVDVTNGKKVSPDVLTKLDKSRENFGHAGPEFVRYLISKGWHNRREDLKKKIADTADEIAGNDVAPALCRAAQVFALVRVAGELAAEAGLIDSAPIKGAVKKAFKAFADSDEGRATIGGDALLDSFRSWVVRAQSSQTLVPADDANATGYREARGWLTKELIILDYECLSDMKGMGLSGKRDSLVAVLKKAGALVMSGKNNIHSSLPSEVESDKHAPKNRKVRNIRIERRKLGV